MTKLVRTFQAEVSAKNPAERRLNIRLLDYWQVLRGERSYPTLQDFKFDAVDGLKPFSFLLEFSDGDIDPVFRYIGEALTEDCGQNLLQKPVSEVPRHTLLTQVTDHCLQVLAHKAPISFEAEYIDAAGDDVLYRSILLPLSSDGEVIDCVVGAINRKENSSETTISHPDPEERAENVVVAAVVEKVAPVVAALSRPKAKPTATTAKMGRTAFKKTSIISGPLPLSRHFPYNLQFHDGGSQITSPLEWCSSAGANPGGRSCHALWFAIVLGRTR